MCFSRLKFCGDFKKSIFLCNIVKLAVESVPQSLPAQPEQGTEGGSPERLTSLIHFKELFKACCHDPSATKAQWAARASATIEGKEEGSQLWVMDYSMNP